MSDRGTGAGEERHKPGDGQGGGSDTREIEMAGTSVTPQDRQSFACPNCGHELSMYIEPDGFNRAEVVAARLADLFGSWLFMLLLAVAIVTWLAVNLVVGALETGPSAVLSNLDIALAVVAAMQGPLILLTQRRDAERDRARDIEIFHIALNTEEDVHAIRAVIERTPGMGTSIGTVPPADASSPSKRP